MLWSTVDHTLWSLIIAMINCWSYAMIIDHSYEEAVDHTWCIKSSCHNESYRDHYFQIECLNYVYARCLLFPDIMIIHCIYSSFLLLPDQIFVRRINSMFTVYTMYTFDVYCFQIEWWISKLGRAGCTHRSVAVWIGPHHAYINHPNRQ